MPTQDELEGLYDASKSHTRKVACDLGIQIHLVTELIDITCIGSWADETSGPARAYFFLFNNGVRNWTTHASGLYYRALPVRSAK